MVLVANGFDDKNFCFVLSIYLDKFGLKLKIEDFTEFVCVRVVDFDIPLLNHR